MPADLSKISSIMKEMYKEQIEEQIRRTFGSMKDEPEVPADFWMDRRNKILQYWMDQLELAEENSTDFSWIIKELHYPDKGKCQGCDFEGYEAESPEWPCRTARHFFKGDSDYEPQFWKPKVIFVPPTIPPGSGKYIDVSINLERH